MKNITWRRYVLPILLPILGLMSVPIIHAAAIKNIVFDLDGVLLETRKLAVMQRIGPLNIASYFWETGRLPSQTELFHVLETVPAISTEKSYSKGMLMPQIMVDWQVSAQNAEQILNLTHQHLEASALSSVGKTIYKNMTRSFFYAKDFVDTRSQITDGELLIQDIKKIKGLRFYVLSNWDKESFPLILKKYPKLFSHFDGIMISGQVGTLKPNQKMYEKFLEEFHLQAGETVLIDDELKNIEGSRKIGFHGILCEGDYSRIREQLTQLMSH